jgi:hypothetical protein
MNHALDTMASVLFNRFNVRGGNKVERGSPMTGVRSKTPVIVREPIHGSDTRHAGNAFDCFPMNLVREQDKEADIGLNRVDGLQETPVHLSPSNLPENDVVRKMGDLQVVHLLERLKKIHVLIAVPSAGAAVVIAHADVENA